MLWVANEEFSEDMQKIGGTEALDEPYLEMPILKLFKKRVVWLIVLFLGEMLTATAMGYFEDEIAKAVVLGAKDRKTIDQTLLHDYIFEWGETRRQACIALGYVSLYNHSFTSNCEYEMDYDYQLITIRAVRSIRKGEELTINYNGTWNDARALWFEVTGH